MKQWTHDIPTEPGYYWYKAEMEEVQVVHVNESIFDGRRGVAGEFDVWQCGGECWTALPEEAEEDMEWCGPIDIPTKETE